VTESLDLRQPPFISVCITTLGNTALLDACLRSLKGQVGPPFELLVCCKGDLDCVGLIRQQFPEAIVGYVPGGTPGEARNFLIQRSRGEWLLFLDDDVTFTSDFLQRLATIGTQHGDVMVIGGPNLTPPSSPLFEIVQGAVLGSLLATGPVRRRYGQHPPALADERYFTLCNLAVRRDVMIPFPESLAAGEENVVLNALAEQHVPMKYDPDMWVYHQRRSTFGAFATQLRKYGRGRGRVMILVPRSCRPVHFAPFLLLLWVVSLPFLAVLITPWWLLTVPCYGLILLVSGTAIACSMVGWNMRDRLRAFTIGSVLCATVHFNYAWGLIVGLVRPVPAPTAQWSDVPAVPAVDPGEEMKSDQAKPDQLA
jgi:Glycosyl transferase family 2